MKKFIFLAVVAAYGLLAGDAWATKIDTTRASVDKECGLNQDGSHKSGCTRSCGRASCHYHCDGNNCTVNITRTR
jgi:hypothetical protein